ncbi:MAG: hypothetical protein ACTHNQ_02320 [Microbacterium sp.]|uniref:hypothetical protein n=1 Tax=Microbacterium sp. TaxID=51671 RepID=UPI003F8211C3
MSWTHSYRTEDAGDGIPVRLLDARDAFMEAQRTLEAARDDLLRAHAETNRLWGSSR